MKLSTGQRPRTDVRRKAFLHLELLEPRETPTVGLGSAFRLGGSNFDSIRGVATDRLGNTYTTGFFMNTVDFDPGPGTVNRTSNGGEDLFIAKYDRFGALQWVHAIGGGQQDLGNDIAVDSNGDVVVTGYFSDVNVDFDPGSGATLLSAVEGRDIFVARYSASGALVWAKSAGGGDQFSSLDDDEGIDLALDGAGNVVVAGFFQNTVDFDPSGGQFQLTSNGSTDVFLWKLDAAGNFVAAEQRGSFGDDRAESIVADQAGNFHIVGTFSSFITLDPDTGAFHFTDNGNGDVFVMKVNGNLKTTWGDAFGGPGADLVFDVAVDSIGNLLVGGRFFSAVDFDSGPGTMIRRSNGMTDAFVVTYASSGALRNVITFGGPDVDQVAAITPLSGRTFAVAGRFGGTVDFDPGPGVTTRTSAGNGDGYVAAFNLDGGLVWVKSFGGANDDSPVDQVRGAAGAIITVGSFFSAPADFDPNAGVLNLSSAGQSDGFLLRLADRPDLVSRTAAGRWGVARNNGDSFANITFAGVWNEKLKWTNTFSGDFNGDGRNDVLSRNALGDWWLAAMNAQGRFVTRHWGRSDPKTVLRFVSSGDFTGDGLLDVCGFDANGYWHILVNTGAGFRNELRGQWDEPAAWIYASAGDVNGDGLADLIGRNKLGEWWVSLNTGDGGFDHTQWGQWTESAGWLDVYIGDLNADGRLDVVARNKTGSWLAGLGQSNHSFTFANWGNWTAIQSTIKNVYYGDFNGDGFLDVVGRTASHQLQWSLGNGATFAAPVVWGVMAVGSVTWLETLVGDFDGDGRDDLAGRTNTGAWFVARSPGGAFTSSQWTIWLATAGWRDTRHGGFLS